MPDDPKIPEKGPEGESKPELAERLPHETFWQHMKRLSQTPRVGNGRVKLNSADLGPITIFSTSTAKPPKDDPKE